jgi:hypothetical protein
MIFYISSRKLKIMSNELLQQLAQELAQVLGGGGNGNGLGFCPIPENQNAVRYLFPGYEECGAGRPPYLVALDNNVRVPIPQPAIKCKLKFLNLIDATTGGVDKQKLEFWIDCGNRTYVIYLGWADANGKLNNATESFLKALASLTPDELLEPFTFALSRLIDKPSFDPSKAGVGAGKVLLVDVWKNSGERVFSEQASMDANAAAGAIVRINQHLTGQAVLTPRQPKSKTVIQQPIPVVQPQQPQQYQQQPPQQQWGSSAPQNYQQPIPVVQPQQPQVVGGLTPEMAAQFAQFQAQQAQAAPILTPPPAPIPQMTSDQMAQYQQFLATQAQQSLTPPPAPIPQMTSDQMAQYQQFLAMQAQQSLTPPPQWGSVAPTPPPAPVQNGGGGKVNW